MRWVVMAAVVAAVGCGSSEVPRYRVTGAATFDGAPLPAGTVVFTPDPAKGNVGPQGRADIRDGAFDTADDGLGAVGGPTVVEVVGRAADGRVVCRYKTTAELPRASGTQDVAVPASAAVTEKAPAEMP